MTMAPGTRFAIFIAVFVTYLHGAHSIPRRSEDNRRGRVNQLPFSRILHLGGSGPRDMNRIGNMIFHGVEQEFQNTLSDMGVPIPSGHSELENYIRAIVKQLDPTPNFDCVGKILPKMAEKFGQGSGLRSVLRGDWTDDISNMYSDCVKTERGHLFGNEGTYFGGGSDGYGKDDDDHYDTSSYGNNNDDHYSTSGYGNNNDDHYSTSGYGNNKDDHYSTSGYGNNNDDHYGASDHGDNNDDHYGANDYGDNNDDGNNHYGTGSEYNKADGSDHHDTSGSENDKADGSDYRGTSDDMNNNAVGNDHHDTSGSEYNNDDGPDYGDARSNEGNNLNQADKDNVDDHHHKDEGARVSGDSKDDGGSLHDFINWDWNKNDHFDLPDFAPVEDSVDLTMKKFIKAFSDYIGTDLSSSSPALSNELDDICSGEKDSNSCKMDVFYNPQDYPRLGKALISDHNSDHLDLPGFTPVEGDLELTIKNFIKAFSDFLGMDFSSSSTAIRNELDDICSGEEDSNSCKMDVFYNPQDYARLGQALISDHKSGGDNGFPMNIHWGGLRLPDGPWNGIDHLDLPGFTPVEGDLELTIKNFIKAFSAFLGMDFSSSSPAIRNELDDICSGEKDSNSCMMDVFYNPQDYARLGQALLRYYNSGGGDSQ